MRTFQKNLNPLFSVIFILSINLIYSNYVGVFIGNSILKEAYPVYQAAETFPDSVLIPEYYLVPPSISNLTIYKPILAPETNITFVINQSEGIIFTKSYNPATFSLPFTFEYNLSNETHGSGSGTIEGINLCFETIYQFVLHKPNINGELTLDIELQNFDIGTNNTDVRNHIVTLLHNQIETIWSIIAGLFNAKIDTYFEDFNNNYPDILNYTLGDGYNMSFNTSASYGKFQNDGYLTFIDGETIGNSFV